MKKLFPLFLLMFAGCITSEQAGQIIDILKPSTNEPPVVVVTTNTAGEVIEEISSPCGCSMEFTKVNSADKGKECASLSCVSDFRALANDVKLKDAGINPPGSYFFFSDVASKRVTCRIENGQRLIEARCFVSGNGQRYHVVGFTEKTANSLLLTEKTSPRVVRLRDVLRLTTPSDPSTLRAHYVAVKTKEVVDTPVVTNAPVVVAEPGASPVVNGGKTFSGNEADFVTKTDAPAINNALTLEAWVKPSAWRSIPGKGGKERHGLVVIAKTVIGKHHDYVMSLMENGYLCYGMTKGTVGICRPVVPLNKWSHIAITVKEPNEIKFYVNGVDQGAWTKYDSDPPMADLIAPSAAPLYVGGSFQNGWPYNNNNFIGNLSEVRIWNVARSAEEIKATYATRVTGNEPGLVAYWEFQ